MQSTALFGIVLAIATSGLIYELVHVVNADAMTYLALTRDSYDVIVLDFPDPTQLALGKLYTPNFYALGMNRPTVRTPGY